MTSTTMTFVTGTAEVKRRGRVHDPYNVPEQGLDSRQNTPAQVEFVDGKCTCCPYGYHVDLDFLNFCQDLESGSTLNKLKHIQRTKRNLRKSMEIMLSSQEEFTSDQNSTPPTYFSSNEDERLLHMISYEQSATHDILRHIDFSISKASHDDGGVWKYQSSGSAETKSDNIMPYEADNFQDGGSSHRIMPAPGLTRSDSMTSMSSESTMSSEYLLMHQAELVQQHQHSSMSSRTTTKVVENPVLEMATAEMKHYSTTSSAQLVDNEVEPTDKRKPSVLVVTASTNIPRTPADVNENSIQQLRESMAVSLQRIKVLEQQVKTIPILQVRISVLKEEKRLLNLQLKASRTTMKPQTSSVGVGDCKVNIMEDNDYSAHSSRTFQLSTTITDASSPYQKSPVFRSQPLPLPKLLMTSSIGVGDHSVLEPYNIQPNLPTGYTIQDNETTFEIHSRTFLEEERLMLHRNQTQALTFQQGSGYDTSNRDLWESTSQDVSKLNLNVNQIQNNIPKTFTRTIGIGEGNVFEDSTLHVHEKEMRTLIMDSNKAPAKRNVGIECRVPTRDVGVSFKCDETKPETRTVGVNVNYDTTGIVTSLDFKGETQLRMALQGVLHRNVRSVGTNCILKQASVDYGTMTDLSAGVSVGCGDDDHRLDVEIRPATVRKSAAVLAKPDVGHKCISTETDWTRDAGTSTYEINLYDKAVMTDKQKQAFVSTNTETTPTHSAVVQTEKYVFMNMDQVKHAASNTENVARYSTGMSTDIIATQNACINTVEKVTDLFQVASNQKNIVSSQEQRSLQRQTETLDRAVDDHKINDIDSFSSSNQFQTAVTSKVSDMVTQEQVIDKNSNHEGTFLSKSGYMKTSSRMDYGDKHYSSLIISKRSSPLNQGYISQESQITRQDDFSTTDSIPESVSPATPEDRFSETVVEHFLLTKDGKKLISEETITTSSSGTNRTFVQYTDGKLEQPTSIHQKSFAGSSPVDEIDQGHGNSGSGSYNTSSSGNYSLKLENGSTMVAETDFVNQSSLKDVSEVSTDMVDGSSSFYSSSRMAKDDFYRGSQQKTNRTEEVSSAEIIYDMRRTGSVEDFMPNDIRKYMSIDPSTISCFRFGEDVTRKSLEELSDVSAASTASTTSGSVEMKSFKMSRAAHINKTADKMLWQSSEVLDGRPSDNLPQILDQRTSAFSSATSSSRNLGDQDHMSITTNDGMPTDKSITTSSMSSFSETDMTMTVGGSSEVSSAEGGSYGSMERRQAQLKSIMKHKTETQSSCNKKGITFAESVTGGTGSSSEDNNCSDADSTESLEEDSNDGQDWEMIDYKEDEAITVSLPDKSYELSDEVRNACFLLDTYLADSASIQTQQLDTSKDIVQELWFKLSSHKVSNVHHVDSFMSLVTDISLRLLEYIVNLTDANGNTAIHYCISHCNFEIASRLLDSKVCDINKRNKAGFTPIMLAGLAVVQNQQHHDTIRRILSLGEINAKATSTQQTALMLAASHGRTEMVKLLIEVGADINLQDEDGSTALMCACEHGHLEVVNFLLTQPSINVDITDNENSTAIKIAMDAGHKDIGVVLYKYQNFSKVSSPGSHKKRKGSSSPT